MLIENPNGNKTQADAEFIEIVTIYQYEPASRFKRWLASVINNIIGVVILLIGSLLGDLGYILAIFLCVGLQLYFIKTYGQTIAKRWLGLRVFDYNTNQPIEFGKYIGRELIDFLFAWTNFLLLVSGIVALVRDDRRSLTDLLIGSVVLQDKK